jgi:hypothetical protein
MSNRIIISAIPWWEQVNFQWDDEVRSVLDQHAYLQCYSASSLKQQFADKDFTPLGHIIMIARWPVFAFTPHFFVLRVMQEIPIILSLVQLDRGWNQGSKAHEASTLTITPSIRLPL